MGQEENRQLERKKVVQYPLLDCDKSTLLYPYVLWSSPEGSLDGCTGILSMAEAVIELLTLCKYKHKNIRYFKLSSNLRGRTPVTAQAANSHRLPCCDCLERRRDTPTTIHRFHSFTWSLPLLSPLRLLHLLQARHFAPLPTSSASKFLSEPSLS